MMNRPLLFAALIAATTACIEPESGSIQRTMVADSGAVFEVEVRYAGGFSASEAHVLASSLELVPAREMFPELDPAFFTNRSATDEPLDGSEPTFEVVLHPLDAAAEPHTWRTRVHPQVGMLDDTSSGLASIEQAVTSYGYVDLQEELSPHESWRTARYRCHAAHFFAGVLGPATACIDLGYEGKAGSVCQITPLGAFLVHAGPNLNPLDKHYFRGRVTAKVLFTGTYAAIDDAFFTCL
jgi:hypothetical protein